MEYVLGPDGQRMWNQRPGTPGGPFRYALRRLPIRTDAHAPELRSLRSDPDADPYREQAGFRYRKEWTGTLFNEQRFIIRAAFMDVRDELREARRAIIRAGFPAEAMAVYGDLSRVDWNAATGPIRETLRKRDRIGEVRLAREISNAFRKQFLEARTIAEKHSASVTTAP
jgi:hypothetical protein